MSQIILSNASSPLAQALSKNSVDLSPFSYGLSGVFPNSAKVYSTTTPSGGLGFNRKLSFAVSRWGLWSDCWITVGIRVKFANNTAIVWARNCGINMCSEINICTGNGKQLIKILPQCLEYCMERLPTNQRDAYAAANLENPSLTEGTGAGPAAAATDPYGILGANGGVIEVHIPISADAFNFASSRCYFNTQYIENLVVEATFKPVGEIVKDVKLGGSGPATMEYAKMVSTFIQLESSIFRKLVGINYKLNSSLTKLGETDVELLRIDDPAADPTAAATVPTQLGPYQITNSELVSSIIIGVARRDTGMETLQEWAQIETVKVEAAGNVICEFNARTISLFLAGNGSMNYGTPKAWGAVAAAGTGGKGSNYAMSQSSRLIHIPFKMLLDRASDVSATGYMSLRNLSNVSVTVTFWKEAHSGSGKTHTLIVSARALSTLSISSSTGENNRLCLLSKEQAKVYRSGNLLRALCDLLYEKLYNKNSVNHTSHILHRDWTIPMQTSNIVMVR